MYVPHKRIVDVYAFTVHDSEVYYKTTGRLKEKGLRKENTIYQPSNITEFAIINNSLCYSTFDNETYKIDLKDNKKRLLKFHQLSNYLFKNELVFRTGNKVYVPELNLEFEREFFSGNFIAHSSFIFKTNKLESCIECHSIQNHKIGNQYKKWKFTLSELGQWTDQEGQVHDYEVQHFVGVSNNLIWIFLKRGLFIALDINTGSLKYKFEGVHASNKEGEVDEYLGEKDIYHFFFRTKYILDQEKGRIIGFNADRYYEIDLTMDKLIPRLYGMLDQFQKLGVGKYDIGYTPVLRNDKLYFLMIEQGRFGVFDTISKKIIYVSDPININPENGKWAELREIQVSENKLYILASDNVLHIFEKEE